VLKALVEEGGKTDIETVYGHVERSLREELGRKPEERECYESGDPIWKNQTRQSRRDLVEKGQLDGSQRGIWNITKSGLARLAEFERTGIDPDEPQDDIDFDNIG
jgi:hypothetical protein